MTTSPAWLALDIGGANLKGAHSEGRALSISFPIWKAPERLAGKLRALVESFPRSEQVAITMTAELCDCYATKRDGVNAILDAIEAAVLPGPAVWIWGTDARFHTIATIREQPRLAAASNWIALATSVAKRFRDDAGLLIDIGSTTTDLIPFEHGRVVAQGSNDLERLQTGELVYAGVSRTPLCALATEVPFRGKSTGLAAELFATTRDLYLTFGEISEDPADRETADGQPATRSHSRDRLARMVGDDREGFSDDDALALSKSLDHALLVRLCAAARRALSRLSTRCNLVVIAGSGEFLARRLVDTIFEEGEVASVEMGKVWGPVASTAACASALLEIAADPHAFPEESPLVSR